jgi:hypothetical protein
LLQYNIFDRIQFRARRGVGRSARRERSAPAAHAVLKPSRPADGLAARAGAAFALVNTRQLCNYKGRAQVKFLRRQKVC